LALSMILPTAKGWYLVPQCEMLPINKRKFWEINIKMKSG
jgi:hypothetical protein